MCRGLFKPLEKNLQTEPFSELIQVHSDMLKISNEFHPGIFIDRN